jgi:hypothetical protein
MATENIVLLACAAGLVTLHLLGGSLSGLVPRSRHRRRIKLSQSADRSEREGAPSLARSESKGGVGEPSC